MAKGKKITAQDVAAQFEWDIQKITEFCADVFEDANDHNVSGALSALGAEDYELACEFIKLEEDQAEAGELTPELSDRRKELLDRLREA